MNYSRKKIALLMGALIIGQVITLQNIQGMDAFGGDNTEENANVTYDFWSNTISNLYNKLTNLYSDMSKNKFIKIAIQRTGVCDAVDGARTLYNYDYATLYNNASTQGHVLYNQASDKVITLKNELDERASTLYNNASTQGRSLYNQASEKAITIKNGVNDVAATLHTNVSTWYTDDAPRFHNSLREAVSKDFWVRALPIVHNNAIEYQNDAVQCIENIKNIPNTIEHAVKDKVKNEAADAFNLNRNAPIDANVIVDAVAKQAIISLTKYATVVAAGLFATYKTYMYGIHKYQEYQKAHALDESINQYLTDEKKAEIAQLTGKELSADDVQEIINTIKTHATPAEDSRVTQEIVDLVVKEYVAKQVNV